MTTHQPIATLVRLHDYQSINLDKSFCDDQGGNVLGIIVSTFEMETWETKINEPWSNTRREDCDFFDWDIIWANIMMWLSQDAFLETAPVKQ